MSTFTRVSGDYQPVSNFDARSYTVGSVNAVTSASTVQPQGPKLEFFTATANGALTTTQIDAGMKAIQQLATVHMYEYTDASNDTLAVAVYPVGAWTTAALVTALEDAGWANAVTVTASATFTN